MTTYDVQLDADGDLPARTAHISGPDLIAQRIRARLRTFRGEWFLDQRRGLPILEWKQQRPPDTEAIRARINREIRGVPGVIRVEDLAVEFEGGALAVTGSVVVEDQALVLRAEISGDDGNAQPVVTLLLG